MDGFREGFEFFAEHASDFAGMDLGSGYVDSVNGEISEFIESVAHFKGMQSSVDTLKGDLAEFWHAGTFNIDAAVKGSGNRVQVDRSHDFGSVDVSGKNIELDAGLKYYKNGVESAKQQAKSVFEAYKKYQSGGGKETLEEYLKNRNYQDDSVLNDAVYSGQIRVIPADQLTEATKWLERKIAEEGSKRPEQVERYRETLKLLKDRISDNHGNESIPLSEEDAKKLAQLAKAFWVNKEATSSTYVAAINEEPVVPEYDYTEVVATITSLDEKIAIIKHALNVTNSNEKVRVGDAEMSIDTILIKMAQLNKRKSVLDQMRKQLPKAREEQRSYMSRNTVPEYRYINYDLELIKKEYETVSKTIMEMQMALDKYNQTVQFEVDI